MQKIFDFLQIESVGIRILVLIIMTLLVLLVASVTSGITSWVERRVAGRMQSRIGPNRVGPCGFLQWIADALKLFQKEDIIPEGASRVLFRLAPFFGFLEVGVMFSLLPWGKPDWILADFNIGILLFLGFPALAIIGELMAGWGSNNKWSLIGGMRGTAQIISYEIPAAIALLPAILSAQGLSFKALMGTQSWEPWNWFIFHSPFAFVSGFIFFIASLAEANRTPFDLTEAESELVSGYTTEYTGVRFALFILAEYANVYILSAAFTAIFLGGGLLPAMFAPYPIFYFLAFFIKACIVLLFVIWIRWTLLRVRIDQLMVFCWTRLVPIALASFFGEIIYLFFVHAFPIIQQVVSIACFIFGLFILYYLQKRVRFHISLQKLDAEAKQYWVRST